MHRKFIAEKVFDILQESWKEINSLLDSISRCRSYITALVL
uniref:Uncharacterized protein n=1 Tax=Arundo donax TaxID=35708 RepID=A0A0A9FX09_ARUDO